MRVGAAISQTFSKKSMSSDPESKSGCASLAGYSLLTAILIGLAFTAVQLATNWWSERPAQMLQRFLQVEEEGITNLQTDYRRGIDFTANIYFESNSETIAQLLAERSFIDASDSPSPKDLDRLRFAGAPDPGDHSISLYKKLEGSVYEYLGISRDGTKLWYCAQDY